MAEQTIIARKRIRYKNYIYCTAVLLIAAALFVILAYLWKDKDPDAFIPYLGIAAGLAACSIIFIVLYALLKRRPEVLIWYEDGIVKFYNGCECRPEEILDIRSTYNTTKSLSGTISLAASGNITVVTPRGKINCRRISDVRLAYNSLMSLKYGKMYMPEELRVLMSKREKEKF